jgi:predicted phosphodiesterase
MRVAALYDIHGNLPALEAVLREVDDARPDLILVGGDVFPGPFPRATIDRLLAEGERVRFIRGNADREVIAAFDGVPFREDMSYEVRADAEWTARQLDRSHRDLVAAWPEMLVLPVEGVGDVLFCHGSPRSDEEILTAATSAERLGAALEDVTQSLVVCGHTHMQFDLRLSRVRVVNAGSVGMSYGEPGAFWLLLGPDVTLRRTSYDLKRASAAIRASGYPQAYNFAENNVLHPPSAAEVIEVFERYAEQRASQTR